MSAGAPEGTVTLLFTDIQGSTRLLDRLGEEYADLLKEHHRLMRAAIAACGGREVDTAGDSFFAVFPSAWQAVECARRAQLMLAERAWPGGESLLVRMGIHTGTPTVHNGDYLGIDVHSAARVMAVAYGGQVLLTDAAREVLDSRVELRDLGHHLLKDLPAPVRLFQLLAPGLLDDFPALRTLNRSNLPTPATPLVDRREETATALSTLGREDVRVLSLLGTGGTGKTRLAIEVAGEAVRRYRDGVWIVPLAPVGDPALMLSEIARVLGVEPVAGESLERRLMGALAERELLLVLDNFEHLIPAAGLLAELISAAPGVDVLATSREALRIRGEHRLEVRPLAPPDARELFTQRALAVRPDLELSDADGRSVERICARLDGLPLALELAAARIAIFRPAALEARLADRLALPAGDRDLPERQRTLRATIDWSYQLLSPSDSALLRSLAPFIGGVRIDSAEAIWGPGAIEGLISLSEKSLLRRREDPDGETRLWMLETIRQFVTERAVAEGNAEKAADVHAEHFLALAEQVSPQLLQRDQRQWLDVLEADHANLRAALERLIGTAPVRALRLAGALRWFWDVRGYAPEARRRFAEVLAAAPSNCPERAEVLLGAGRVALTMGAAQEAEPLLLEALPLARSTGDARMVGHVLSHLGWAAQALGDPARSIARQQEAVAQARAAGDDFMLGGALNNLGEMLRIQGDIASAQAHYKEALAVARALGEPRAIAMTACNLAGVTLDQGDLGEAERLLDDAVKLAREIDYRALLGGALALRAAIALHRGDVERAGSELLSAIGPTRSAADLETTTVLLSAAATLAAIRGDPLSAATLWAATDDGLAHLGREEMPAAAALRGQWLPAARAAAPDGWDAAWGAGARLSLDEALALASTLRAI